MAKYQQRAVVILYEGSQLTEDVEAALLSVVAPFTGNKKSRVNVLQLDANDIAQAVVAKADNGARVIHFDTKTAENQAAALVGLTFEDELKSLNPVKLAITVYNTVNRTKSDASDGSIALLRGLKLVSKPGFSFLVGNDILEKYNLTASNLQVIRDVLKSQGIHYE